MRLDLTLPARRRAISLTPLIDVVFILLLFFMLSSTFTQWRQLDLAVPGTGAATPPVQHQVQLLSEDGRFRLDNLELNLQDRGALDRQISQQSDDLFVISADSGIATQTLIELLDALKAAGARQLSLAQTP
ncbi:biopolymer transporter TolR [Marinobacterium aestuarii]|uniref:Biopolymer transporter TolR n=1 Tax=Marinobacterium aestuarii TaxID=1821621 RepID=A0A1A9EUX6_9GAMM|nr:biopolymer transporter ExbD [Marinobacterium aestuarii]ANG61716.1 biopolymer transporter TolR [Marinobacterium aestuarii]